MAVHLSDLGLLLYAWAGLRSAAARSQLAAGCGPAARLQTGDCCISKEAGPASTRGGSENTSPCSEPTLKIEDLENFQV